MMGRMGFEGMGEVYMYEYANLNYNTADTVDPIVQNEWYVALAETPDVKGYYLIVEQTNNGATVETIVVELTINGTTYTSTNAGAVSGSLYYYRFNITGGLTQGITDPFQLLARDGDQSAPLETRSLQIRVRQTTAVDPVAAQIEVNMVYATLEVT